MSSFKGSFNYDEYLSWEDWTQLREKSQREREEMQVAHVEMWDAWEGA